MQKISFISHGAGQDSTFENYRVILDPVYRLRVYGNNKIVAVCCDTGDEHPDTYRHIEFLKKLNADNGIEFYHLTSDMGFHSESWASLSTQYEKNHNLAFRSGGKSCTDNLKIVPFYKFINSYLGKELGYEVIKDHGKPHLKEYSQKFGKVDVFIGFAKGEETRAKKTVKYNETKAPKWRKESVNFIFPLIDDGMERQDLINYMDASPYPTPFPSNCMMCPYMSDHELLFNWRNHPKSVMRWIRYEKRKLTKDIRVHGIMKDRVFSKKLNIIEKLRKVKEKIGHLTDQELAEYKFSHGHCIKNGY